MKIECEKLLKGYPTTLEHDLELLVNDDEGKGPHPLTENHRNATLMRSGEKKVLKYLSATVDIILPLLDKNLQTLKKEMKALNLTEDQTDYIKYYIFPLVSKENK